MPSAELNIKVKTIVAISLKLTETCAKEDNDCKHLIGGKLKNFELIHCLKATENTGVPRRWAFITKKVLITYN